MARKTVYVIWTRCYPIAEDTKLLEPVFESKENAERHVRWLERREKRKPVTHMDDLRWPRVFWIKPMAFIRVRKPKGKIASDER